MLRKILVGAAVVAGSLAVAAPAMATSGPYFAGVYPSVPAAQAACDAGKAQGRWDHCAIKGAAGQQAVMYVWKN
ncbi:hypothetical protein [Saccharopolyspora phatthalungensis]|uniref:DUF4189 domain-containing protein n=1 Tax=Saccharopolyspora phatthalungensis TaxID=664693 RepID=A0A840QJZ6_9PSEU|nr:hypothetical protein [Saccharopolyspora phatthalungensis]MBB5159599.1 hypothetical protein [Saccharopolyspora phatthalungensis]